MSGASYAVHATLDVRTAGAQRALRSLAADLLTISRRIRTVENDLTSMARRLNSLNGLQRPFASLVSEMQKLRRATSDTGTAADRVTTRLQNQAAAMTASAQAAKAMAAAYGQMATAQTAAAQAPRVARLRAPAQPGAPGQASQRGQGPLWRRMIQGAAEGDERASRTADRGVNNPARLLDPQAGAYFGFQAIGQLIERGGELRDATVGAEARMGPENADWVRRLRETAARITEQVPGTTTAGNIGAGMALAGDVANLEDVLRLLPTIQQITQGLVNSGRAGGKSGMDAERASTDVGRFLGLRGAGSSLTNADEPDPERLRREARLLQRNFIAQPEVSPREWANFAQRARVGGQMMSEDALYGGFGLAGIRAMTGHVFGTSLAAFNRQFVRGIMPKSTAAELQELGLITSTRGAARVPEREIAEMERRGELQPEEAEAMRGQHILRLSRQNLYRPDLAATDADRWQRDVREMLGRAGKIDPNNPRALDALTTRMGSTSTGQGFLQWLFDEPGRQADINMVRRVRPEAGEEMATRGFTAAQNAISGAFRTLLQTTGESDAIVKAMNDMAGAIRNAAAFMRENPGFIDEGVERFRKIYEEIREFVRRLNQLVTDIQALLDRMGGWGAIVNRVSNSFNQAVGASQLNLNNAELRPGAGAGPRQGPTPEYDIMGNPLGTTTDLGAAAPGPRPPRDATGIIQVPPGTRGQTIEVTPAAPSADRPPGPQGNLQLQNFTPGDASTPPPQQVAGIFMDGRRVGDVVFPHLGRNLNGPASAQGRFDARRNLAPADVAVA